MYNPLQKDLIPYVFYVLYPNFPQALWLTFATKCYADNSYCCKAIDTRIYDLDSDA
jgi:hypothetical protein